MAGTKTAGYKLATYQSADGPRAGLVVDDKVFDAAKLTGKAAYASVIGILEDWKAAEGALKAAAAKAAKSRVQSRPLKGTKLLAPVLWPSAIYCAGANYADHVAEMNKVNGRPPEPDPHTLGLQSWHFIKASRSLSNPGATVKISDYSKKMDWEIELAAVIGRKAKNVPQKKRAFLCGGLHLRQRSLGARPRPPAARGRHLPVQGRLGGAQELRRLLPARALDRAGERHPGPAESRPQAVGQRRAQAGFQHRPDDLQPGRADRPSVVAAHPASGRPDPDRHAGRRRRRPRRVPQGRRRGEDLDRADRRA